MTPASCTLCKFYSPNMKDPNGHGLCRRKPPTAFPMGMGPKGSITLTVWPTVKPSDWCAEGESGVSHDSAAAGQQVLDKKNGHHH